MTAISFADATADSDNENDNINENTSDVDVDIDVSVGLDLTDLAQSLTHFGISILKGRRLATSCSRRGSVLAIQAMT
jgi:hypothetical protein